MAITRNTGTMLSAGQSIGVLSLDQMAAAICDQALTQALERIGPSTRSAPLSQLLERRSFKRAFVRALAIAVAQALAANDQRALAVYAYGAAPGPAVSAGRDETTLAHLLVLVTAPSAALEAFVTALNRALTVRLGGMLGTSIGRCRPLFDINIVTEQQVQQGVGLARLLSAVRPPPIKLWQRQP